MERDECAVLIASRELLAGIEQHIVRCPVGLESGRGGRLVRAFTHRLAAVTAVLGSQHELLLHRIVVTLRPAVVAALLDVQQDFGRQRRALLRLVEIRPVFRQLIATVLSRIHTVAAGVDGNSIRIANARRETLRGRELLIRLVGVVAPDAAAGLQFGTRLDAGRLELPVLLLAGVGGGGHVDVHEAIRIDRKGMHRMIAAQRHARENHVSRSTRHQRTGRDRVAHDLVVDLRVHGAFVERNSGAARAAGLNRLAEALIHRGLAGFSRILQGDDKTAIRRLVVTVVHAAPRIDVENSVRSHDHVPRMTQLVGENRRTKTRSQLQSAVIVRAGIRLGRCRRRILSHRHRPDCRKSAEQREARQEGSLLRAGAGHEFLPRSMRGRKGSTKRKSRGPSLGTAAFDLSELKSVTF